MSLYRFKLGHGDSPWQEPWHKADVADWLREAVDAAVAAAAKAGGAEPVADLMTAGLLVGGEVRLGLARDPAHLADPGTTVFDTDGNALGAYAALLGPRWRAPRASTEAYSKDWPPARGSADEVPHHETFSTNIQPPYNSTKG